MKNKCSIPQRGVPTIKAGMKKYQVIEAFLSMKGEKKRWAEIAYYLKYSGDNK